MNKEVLRDKNGRRIGEITEKRDGVLELRDRNGRYLGKYDPKRNETRDRNGRLIGKGNLLAMLLKD
ncbi:MAG: hypothetical protein NZ845_00990 [Thermodesulfovibrio sp.]|nr:hypothetical protein [Thermodesulfovibrio sp.]MDW7973131.1 hypothetical protein [Thermodesulfovibrio sp.]